MNSQTDNTTTTRKRYTRQPNKSRLLFFCLTICVLIIKLIGFSNTHGPYNVYTQFVLDSLFTQQSLIDTTTKKTMRQSLFDFIIKKHFVVHAFTMRNFSHAILFDCERFYSNLNTFSVRVVQQLLAYISLFTFHYSANDFYDYIM